MKTLISIFLVSFSSAGLWADTAHATKAEKSISHKVDAEVKQLKKQIEKLEKELKVDAEKKKEAAKDT